MVNEFLNKAQRKFPRTIAMVIYPGAQCLDVTGPLEVFAMANQQLKDDQKSSCDVYRIELLAEKTGPVRMSSGITLYADKPYKDAAQIDTLMVCGGMGDSTSRARSDTELTKWLKHMSVKVRRLVSICNGAFILAEAGLLAGGRATTHWLDAQTLATEFPDVEVDADAIYVRHGNVYTSAGITAGIDLALALVEEDFGRHLALSVAKRLVLYSKRDGGQKQFSGYLASQLDGGEFEDVIQWIYENLQHPMTIPGLANIAAMSPRNFARKFYAQLKITPGKFVEALRVERACQLFEDGVLPASKVSHLSGFQNTEKLRRAFVRHLNILPTQYQRHFSGS